MGRRPQWPSKLDPFLETLEQVLAEQPTLSLIGIREGSRSSGYEGGKRMLDDLLRELGPRFLPPPRSSQPNPLPPPRAGPVPPLRAVLADRGQLGSTGRG
jgi:hypothetical protein